MKSSSLASLKDYKSDNFKRARRGLIITSFVVIFLNRQVLCIWRGVWQPERSPWGVRQR